MAGIFKIANRRPSQPAAKAISYTFHDLDETPESLLRTARDEAARIVAEAQSEADAIRQAAAEQGRDLALQQAREEADAVVRRELATAMPALRQAADAVLASRAAWQQQWESSLIRLAVLIAEKVIRREVRDTPAITADSIREALRIAAGSDGLSVRLHPNDLAALGPQVEALTASLGQLAPAEFIPDADISPGGCLLETRHGSIDLRIERQLARIERELLP